MTLSDLRLSRFARLPNALTTIPAGSTLTIASLTPSGTINKNLLGSLHYLTTGATEALLGGAASAPGVLEICRTDKMLSATPIKAGTVDGTHPTIGRSGSYSYDWQVVDRTLAYYARLGIVPYISLDATPQLLGGNVAPLSGANLTTQKSGDTAFSTTQPNSNSAFAAMCADLAYHITVEQGSPVTHFGLWNEPDGYGFTLAQYEALYALVAPAVKGVSSALKVGGPETAFYNTTWIQGFITYCGANSLPLDFVSWHFYDGDVGTVAQAKAQTTLWATAAGLAAPELLNGEWCWNPSNFTVTGNRPWKKVDMFKNDWAAAFVGATLVEEQAAAPFYTSIFTDSVMGKQGNPASGGFGSTGLSYDSPAQMFSTGNVFRAWNKMGASALASTYAGVPGVYTQAATDAATGRVTVLLSYLKYRKSDPQQTVTLALPLSLAGKAVTDYIIDDQHSDTFDAGIAHTNLEGASGAVVQADGTVTVGLRPRSVHLIEIGGPTLGGTKRRLQ